MQPSYTQNWPVPQVNPQASALPPLPPARQPKPCEIKSAKALKECALFTAGTGQLLIDPRYSLLYNGILLMCEPESGDFLGGLKSGVGFLLVLASPAALLLKAAVLLPVSMAGAVATVATGGATAAEWSGKKIGQHLTGKCTPSEAEKQREHLVQQFANKMEAIIKQMPHSQAYHCKRAPEMLVPITALSVAFLSRSIEKAHTLKVGTDQLSREQLAGQNNAYKAYFDDLDEMKQAIRGLRLSPDDNHAWSYLINSLKSMESASSEAIDLPENEKESLRILKHHADRFTERAVNDQAFQEWKASFVAQ